MLDTPFTTTIPRIRHESTSAVVNERSRIAEAVRKLPAQGWVNGSRRVDLQSVLNIIERQP